MKKLTVLITFLFIIASVAVIYAQETDKTSGWSYCPYCGKHHPITEDHHCKQKETATIQFDSTPITKSQTKISVLAPPIYYYYDSNRQLVTQKSNNETVHYIENSTEKLATIYDDNPTKNYYFLLSQRGDVIGTIPLTSAKIEQESVYTPYGQQNFIGKANYLNDIANISFGYTGQQYDNNNLILI